MKIDKEMKKEIFHSSHPQHNLKLSYTEVPFYCDGCKELGIGVKYECKQCDFDLHKACALASPVCTTHPFSEKCEFRFHEKPPGMKNRVCDACMKDVLGFVYHCNGCSLDLHPCCANLPRVLDYEEHKLYLYHKLSRSCDKCGKKGPGLSYRSECKKYNYHVSCVKNWFMESWKAKSQKKEEVLIEENKKEVRENKKEVRELEIMKIPKHKGTLRKNDKRESGGNKVWKACKKIVTAAVSIIVAAILGDPTSMIIAVVGAFISK